MGEIDYLSEHKYYFKLHMCGCYPFKEEFLEKNKKNLNWNYLSVNENLPWSIDFIEKYVDNWYWKGLSENEFLPWSEELIDRYIDYWNWEILMANEAIIWSEGMTKKYRDRFDPKYSDSGYPEFWINKRGAADNFAHKAKITRLYTPDELKEILKSKPLKQLCLDERIPWSEKLLASHESEWNWRALSINKKLPWSEKLIDRFIEKWDFGTGTDREDGTRAYTIGLSSNSGLPWSLELIKYYESRWDWLCLTYSEHIPWSLEILREFENRWEWEDMIWNQTMWQKVFYPFLDDDIISSLLKNED